MIRQSAICPWRGRARVHVHVHVPSASSQLLNEFPSHHFPGLNKYCTKWGRLTKMKSYQVSHSLPYVIFCISCLGPQINIGCTTDSSSADPVKLEFSRDLGATWHLLLPLCYSSSSRLSSLCSTEHHPSSTYYAGTTQGWRREVIHFGKLHLCG